MTFKNRLLRYLAKKELARNRKFRDLHKGESCYIIGNGVSLKSIDLKKFNDKITIGCNSLFIHKDFDELNCRYYQIPPPLFFQRYRRFYGKIQRNYMGDLYREKMRRHKKTHFFISLSNSLNMRGDNISYTHHFGSKDWDMDQYDMDGVFSFMAGSTYAMVGTAIYMGFKSAVLVGLDYTFSPRQSHHFFEKGPGVILAEAPHAYCGSMFKECLERIDLTTIVPAGMRSDVLKYETYEDYVGSSASYRENTDIVSKDCLDYLYKQGCYTIY